MDATKEQWLRQLYGDRAVDGMKKKIADLAKSLGTKDADFAFGIKSAATLGVRQAMAGDGLDYMGGPYGGATSWSAIDAYLAARAADARLADVAAQFDGLLHNLMSATPIDTVALAAVVSELDARLATKAIADDRVLGYCELAGATGIRERALAAKSQPEQPSWLSVITHASADAE